MNEITLHMSWPVVFTLLFVGLKLAGYIDWSWWLVLAPTWAPIIAGAVTLLIMAFIGLAIDILKGKIK